MNTYCLQPHSSSVQVLLVKYKGWLVFRALSVSGLLVRTMSQGRNGEAWTGLRVPGDLYAERRRKVTAFEEKAENGLPGGILPNLRLNSSKFVISGLGARLSELAERTVTLGGKTSFHLGWGDRRHSDGLSFSGDVG